jgi:hypothetical protein
MEWALLQMGGNPFGHPIISGIRGQFRCRIAKHRNVTKMQRILRKCEILLQIVRDWEEIVKFWLPIGTKARYVHATLRETERYGTVRAPTSVPCTVDAPTWRTSPSCARE